MSAPPPPRHTANPNSQGGNNAWLSRAARELESLRGVAPPLSPTLLRRRGSNSRHVETARFPPACARLLYSLPGNHSCCDCGSASRQVEWASVTFGAVLCVECAGRHRSFGVRKSVVRSITMDAWSHAEVLSMLEGGNAQLQTFFDRHGMGKTCVNNNKHAQRYHTKAARFYSTHLVKHVHSVVALGPYPGREASRGAAATNKSTTSAARQQCRRRNSLRMNEHRASEQAFSSCMAK